MRPHAPCSGDLRQSAQRHSFKVNCRRQMMRVLLALASCRSLTVDSADTTAQSTQSFKRSNMAWDSLRGRRPSCAVLGIPHLERALSLLILHVKPEQAPIPSKQLTSKQIVLPKICFVQKSAAPAQAKQEACHGLSSTSILEGATGGDRDAGTTLFRLEVSVAFASKRA